MIQKFWLYAAIALLAASAFIVSLNNELLYDDMRAGRPLQGIAGLWDFGGWARQQAPLRQLSILADINIWQKDSLAYHALSLCYHSLTTITLLAFLRRLLDRRPAALWAAGLFAILPAGAGAVSVVAHRNEIFGALLTILALWAWLRPRRTPRAWVTGSVCALLALLETRTALALPFIVLAYDLCLKPAGKPKTTRSPLIASGSIFTAMLAAQLLLSWWLNNHGFSRPESWELPPPPGEWPIRFLRDWPAGVLLALRRVIVPEPLSMDLAVTPAAWFETLGGWIIAPALALFIWAQASRRPLLAFGLTWLLASAAVAAAGVFHHKHGAILEQQLYTAGIGLALVAGLAIEHACRLEPHGTRRWFEIGGVAAGALALVCWSNWRASEWESEPKILRATLRHQPSSGLAHLQLGRLFLDAKRVPEAERCFLRAAAANWNYYELFGNLGETAMAKKDYARAEKRYREALALNPDSSGAKFHLGHALFAQQQYAKARECYQELLTRTPRSPTLYKWIANTYDAEDRPYEAHKALDQAKRLAEEERERLKKERHKAAE